MKYAGPQKVRKFPNKEGLTRCELVFPEEPPPHRCEHPNPLYYLGAWPISIQYRTIPYLNTLRNYTLF